MHIRVDDEGNLAATLGREFRNVLVAEARIGEASGADCYSALCDVVARPVTARALASLSEKQIDQLAASFNIFFESRTITAAHISKALSATLKHWPLEGACDG